ncbi:hypothetical protein D3C86_1718200 [compost metagenome]
MGHFGDHVEQRRQITAGQVIRGTASERNQQVDQHHAAVLATEQTLERRHDNYRRPLGFARLLQLLPDRGFFQVTEHHQTEKRAEQAAEEHEAPAPYVKFLAGKYLRQHQISD